MEKNKVVSQIADINTDFTQWYTDVVLKTNLADYGPAKGTMVIREYGYELWENFKNELDRRIKKEGHKNVYFPIFIPLSFFTREAEHVEGFAPELATVTQVGKEILAEPLVVRPTSETVICDAFARWVSSFRDLPVLINQWANVVRMEKTTRPFLRTTEFLWQEGHTLHATREEAEAHTIKMLNMYVDFAKDFLAIPFYYGKKSEKEKFAGAVYTYTVEGVMNDGKSLQCGTSHYLGENFAKVFNINFQDKDEIVKHPHQTSWGMSTRMIGAIIMVHGDERGLRLPPKVAPIQVVIVPIASHKGGVIEKCDEIKNILETKGIKVFVDKSDNQTGWKFNEWELKGVPIRLEIGPKDIEAGNAVLFRRDLNTKSPVSLNNIETTVAETLESIHCNLYQQAKQKMADKTKSVKNMEELNQAIETGNFAFAPWCGSRECEDKIKEISGASSRCTPDSQTDSIKKCVYCGKECKHETYFAKNY
ncbi:MAG: proline--tRNA ligase [Clostridia bacterium]